MTDSRAAYILAQRFRQAQKRTHARYFEHLERAWCLGSYGQRPNEAMSVRLALVDAGSAPESALCVTLSRVCALTRCTVRTQLCRGARQTAAAVASCGLPHLPDCIGRCIEAFLAPEECATVELRARYPSCYPFAPPSWRVHRTGARGRHPLAPSLRHDLNALVARHNASNGDGWSPATHVEADALALFVCLMRTPLTVGTTGWHVGGVTDDTCTDS